MSEEQARKLAAAISRAIHAVTGTVPTPQEVAEISRRVGTQINTQLLRHEPGKFVITVVTPDNTRYDHVVEHPRMNRLDLDVVRTAMEHAMKLGGLWEEQP